MKGFDDISYFSSSAAHQEAGMSRCSRIMMLPLGFVRMVIKLAWDVGSGGGGGVKRNGGLIEAGSGKCGSLRSSSSSEAEEMNVSGRGVGEKVLDINEVVIARTPDFIFYFFLFPRCSIFIFISRFYL